MHTILERCIDLCIVAEPVIIPSSPKWFGSSNRRVGIYININHTSKIRYQLIEAGMYHVAIEYGSYCVVACYLPPSMSYNEYL